MGGGIGVPPTGDGSGAKRGRSGFRILLYVLVGTGAVLVLTCGSAMFFAYRNPTVRKTIDAAIASQSAPGTAGLRAAGCVQATVIDLAAALAEPLERAGGAAAVEIPTIYVTCQLASDAELDCEDIAGIYLESVGEAPGRFVAQVNGAGLIPTPVCQLVFDGQGNRLGTLEEVAARSRAGR
jgi:hypothetical protein